MRAKRLNLTTPKPLAFQLSLSTAISIYPNTLEPILGPNAKSLLIEMEEKFPPFTPHPKEELNTIMFKSGQRSVVEWYRNRLEE